MHLQDYFDRIHYTGSATATLDTLQELHYLHPQYIPFENINPFTACEVKLDMPAIAQKLIYENRGGYCYEQNLLFKEVLTRLGFQVAGLAARVSWTLPPDQVSTKTHMLLLITLDGQRYIADVGFGAVTLTSPLLFQPDIIQQTRHEKFRILQEGDIYLLEILLHNEWIPVYRFNLEEQHFVDYKVANWYVSTHPDSHFVHELIAAKAGPGVRYTLRNGVFTTHYLSGEKDRQRLISGAAVKAVLNNLFGIPVGNIGELDEALERIFNTPASA
ncbi:arylamine N-acetyltransferase family protein [Chitinophaga nivalis]|uniref:Arylamine N-acetyltransferase n=1 Tax=Chitinophaga nivalis TaxID=2991709 RepID=A0ABT3IJG7_9BACT|nr:arylamine N-acetyltransferase [Chitinophaga nivalis]MCW3466225.1 arylamine N-acetyltransferase [Chitinophaga nivalis]MCW3484084.1 arylamine N-acetyltransferase [Chitinophaga nivalis]